MAYFLKKTKNKKGTYLQIYESYYDPERKGGAHRSYKPIGYVHELQASGIEDPITVFGEEVQKLNQEYKRKKQSEKERQISEESPEKLLGYFPLKNLNDSLGCKKYISALKNRSATEMIKLLYNIDVCRCSSCGGKMVPHLPDKHTPSVLAHMRC